MNLNLIECLRKYRELETNWFTTILSPEQKQKFIGIGLQIDSLYFYAEVLFTLKRLKPLMLFTYLSDLDVNIWNSYLEYVIFGSKILDLERDNNESVKIIKLFNFNRISTTNCDFMNCFALLPTIIDSNNNNNDSNNNDSSCSIAINKRIGDLLNLSGSSQTVDCDLTELELSQLLDYPVAMPEANEETELQQLYEVGYLNEQDKIITSYMVPKFHYELSKSEINRHFIRYSQAYESVFNIKLKLKIVQLFDD